jgi:hypothetical protein
MEQQPPMQPPEEQPTTPQSQPFPSQPLPQPSQPLPYPSQPLPPMPQQGYYPPPGQAYPQMMTPQPPKRSRRTLWIILGSLAAVLLVCCIGGLAVVANGGKNSPNTANSSTPGATSNPGQTPTTAAPAGNHKVGETVSYNNEWQITINGAILSTGDSSQFDPTPEAGQTYLVIEGTFKNLKSSAQPLSTLLFFELRDNQGNRYNETILFSFTPPDSSGIPAGGRAHGKWPYEVPTSAHTFTLNFNADLVGDPIIWDITV